jgi:DNA mismatch endonuclease (patch repair protein)
MGFIIKVLGRNSKMADKLTKEQRSYCMSRIRSKNTQIEMIFRKMLFSRGLRFRIHCKGLPGKPDVVFPKYRIAVFIDGDFWHGRDFEERKRTYNKYWFNKIARNMERDQEVDKELRKSGWKIVRIWGNDLKKNPKRFCDRITRMVKA